MTLLNHVGTYDIETPRLLLRRPWYNDAEAMFERWTSDKEATLYLSWAPHLHLRDTVSFIADINSRYSDPTNYFWLICLKQPNGNKEPIGSIAVSEINEDLRCCEVGYVIGREWWGRGIVPEALREVMKVLFVEVGMDCVRARHDSRNSNSGWVMEKCGMKYEGCLRKYGRCNAGISDVCFYSITQEEWFAQNLPGQMPVETGNEEDAEHSQPCPRHTPVIL